MSQSVSRARQQAIAQMLEALLLFLLDYGFSRQQLETLLARSLEGACGVRSGADQLRRVNATLMSTLFAWNRQPRWLDREAQPRALRLRGDGDSIERLIRSVAVRGVDPQEIIRTLTEQKLIRRTRNGRFVPVHHVVNLRTFGAEFSGHVGEMLLRLMETMQSNLQPHNGDDPLIERAVMVRDLPANLLGEFKGFTQEQGSALLANVDEWLEAHRLRSMRGQRSLTAGLHLYAFAAPTRRKVSSSSARR